MSEILVPSLWTVYWKIERVREDRAWEQVRVFGVDIWWELWGPMAKRTDTYTEQQNIPGNLNRSWIVKVLLPFKFLI